MGGDPSLYLVDSHIKDEKENLSNFGTTVLLIFDQLYWLENYVRSVCYDVYPVTFYFQVQFIKVQCTVNVKNAIKYALKLKKSDSQQSKKDIQMPRKENIIAIQEKRLTVKKRYDKNKWSLKQPKKKCVENQISILTYHKAKYLENLQVKLLCNKCGYHETPKMRTKYQKAKYKENFEMKREY